MIDGRHLSPELDNLAKRTKEAIVKAFPVSLRDSLTLDRTKTNAHLESPFANTNLERMVLASLHHPTPERSLCYNTFDTPLWLNIRGLC